MQINQILVDMDGVVADFWSAALHMIGHSDKAKDWPKGEYDIATVCGITQDEMWNKINQFSYFWSSLQPYPWATELYKYLSSVAPVVFATAPCYNTACMGHKVDWLRQQFGGDIRFMLGPDKHLMARQDRILIDDLPKNIKKFNANNGVGVLFPRIWNDDHALADVAFATTIQNVERLRAL